MWDVYVFGIGGRFVGMDIADLRSLYLRELQELCDCYSQMAPAFRNMATAAGSVGVQNAIAQQVEAAVLHKQRLEKILHCHGSRPKADSDEVAAAYVERAQHVMHSTPDPDLRDAALISMLRRIGQYEAAGLAVAEGYAKTLHLGIEQHTLLASMREQKAADERLAALQNEANQLALLVSTPPY